MQVFLQNSYTEYACMDLCMENTAKLYSTMNLNIK
jgi:hypothetical protein